MSKTKFKDLVSLIFPALTANIYYGSVCYRGGAHFRVLTLPSALRKEAKMQNKYEAPDVTQIGEAQSQIRGTKGMGAFDIYTSCEATCIIDIFYDIDE
jgi:hypothetical protein